MASHSEVETSLNSLIGWCHEDYPGTKSTPFSPMPKILAFTLDSCTEVMYMLSST
jgi:hypothetical protein